MRIVFRGRQGEERKSGWAGPDRCNGRGGGNLGSMDVDSVVNIMSRECVSQKRRRGGVKVIDHGWGGWQEDFDGRMHNEQTLFEARWTR